MKQPEDTKTIDMLAPAKRGRGRPSTGCAMTDAERAKKYRAARKEKGSPARSPLYGVAFSRLEDELYNANVVGDMWSGLAIEKDLEIDSLKSQIEDLKFQLKGANALLGDYQRDALPPPVPKRRKAGP